ncbi:MAG: protein-export chaperone SecB [Pseudomonadota bacterium]|nr:protein-export chaperone SecB [Pseudomonadota bacterium]
MSDQSDSDTNESNDDGAATQSEQGVPPQLRIERIFLKDASFESPSAPEVFLRQWRPELKLDINTQANRISETQHQVILTITVTAQLEGDMVGFIVEVQQGGIFHIEGVEANQLAQILGIACPTTLFPYLRESVDGLVVKGGFPPLQLAQVNFEALYVQAMRNQAQQNQATEESTSAGGTDPVTH